MERVGKVAKAKVAKDLPKVPSRRQMPSRTPLGRSPSFVVSADVRAGPVSTNTLTADAGFFSTSNA